MSDLISRQAAIDAVHKSIFDFFDICDDDEESPMTYQDKRLLELNKAITTRIKVVPSAQPERTWYPVTEPPNHHSDVIVRGIEAIGNVTVHKVMQWDVDTWRPTDYAPSIIWKEWSEI